MAHAGTVPGVEVLMADVATLQQSGQECRPLTRRVSTRSAIKRGANKRR